MRQISTALFLIFLAYDAFGKQCTNSAPFLEHMAYGYDLSEFDIYSCPQIGGRKAVIVNISQCNWERKYVMSDVNKTQYEIPDAFSRTKRDERVVPDLARLERDFIDFHDRYLRSRALIHVDSSDFEMRQYFLKNSEYYKEMRKLFATNGAVEVLRFYLSTISAEVEAIENAGKYLKYVSKQFQADADKLPNSLSGNEEKFLEFIRKHGTHYMSYASFGGLIQGYKAIKSNDVAVQNKTFDLDYYKGFDLSKNINVVCQKKDGHRIIHKVFDRERNYTQIMIGFEDHNDFVYRVLPTQYLRHSPAPWLTEMRLISDLFPKQGERQQRDKRESLENAIRLHLVTAANKGAVDIINDLKDKQVVTEKTRQILNKYNTLKDSYDANAHRLLNKELEDTLNDIYSNVLKHN